MQAHTADTPVTATIGHTYPGHPGQARHVRADLLALLRRCPIASDCVLIASELAANAAIHSKSRMPGGTFTVRSRVQPGDYVWLEVQDQGGPWTPAEHADDRPHGLHIVARLAGAGNWGVDGDESGRTVWVRINWPQDGERHAAL